MSSRLPRRAKLANVDYAVLFSGQQIPEFSSEEEECSDDDYVPTNRRKQRNVQRQDAPFARRGGRRSRSTASQKCFICHHATRAACEQCDLCHRWFHESCRAPFASSRSVLGNASCHECLQESRVQAMSAMPKVKVESLNDFISVLKTARNIIVITGAGISVSCGIPDFRSKDGIYAMVQQMDVALPEPECLFHIDFFRDDPAPFFEVIKQVFANSPAPSRSHHFLKRLQDDDKLLRVYSQNVDGLEELAGVTEYIPCHGSLTYSACMRCGARVLTSSLLPVIQAGVIPTCSRMNCRGVLKPEITMYGEKLSDRVSASITKDRLKVDLVLVMGTSLKVSPVAEIPSFVPRDIPQVVINKTPLKKRKLKTDEQDPEPFDLQLLGDCDTIVDLLCEQTGWKLPGKRRRGERAKATEPKLTVHKDLHRICVGTCQCEGLADGQLSKDDKADRDEDDDDDGDSELVCDKCACTLDSTYFICLDCFDYDLCAACYRKTKGEHADGKHTFSRRH